MTPTSFDATLDGRDVCIEFERHTTWSTDHHYGADADGRRGTSVTEIDDDRAEEILVLSWEGPDGAREQVTAFKDLAPAAQAAVMLLIEAYLEKYEPAFEDEEYDPDYAPDEDEGRPDDDD